MTTPASWPVTDSQVHLFPPASRPEADRFGHRVIAPDDLIAEMDQAGVGRAILIPPRVDQATNDGALAVAARWPARLAVVGKVTPDRRDWHSLMRQWPHSAMLGLRVSFPSRRPGPAAGDSAGLWQAADSRGIPMMVWSPGRLGEVREVAQRHPALRLAVDHCGLDATDRGAAATARLPELKGLAECPNVSVKVSALPNHSEGGFPFADLREFISEICASFGIPRMFWGSDLSGLPCSYSECVRMFTEGLDFLSTDEIARIMGGNISGWLAWKTGEQR